jgi:aminopeptidase N
VAGRAAPGAVAVAGVALAALLGWPSLAAAGTGTPGSAGLGDPYFPKAGNGGYEVDNYGLKLRYSPGSGRLDGDARIRATATQDLSRFDLDLRGFHIRRLLVNGDPATSERQGQELIVSPAADLPNGEEFRVRVHYEGQPHHITDPDNSQEGWLRTGDGAVALGEPQGSPAWYPCNDYPTDKATYRIRVTVPRGLRGVANGALVKRHRYRDRTAFVWVEDRPMATYLSTVAIGNFDLDRTHVHHVPSWVAIDPNSAQGTRSLEHSIRTVQHFLARRFGAYPFSATGAIVDDGPDVGYALETQTRPFFPYPPGRDLLVHELAHQWFGDSVTLSRWRDIWLNEGFAAWNEWYWDERHGGPSAKHVFDQLYANHSASDSTFWNPPPGDPGGPQNLFDATIYVRGAMTLQALRERVGKGTFLEILHDWTTQNRYGNVTIPEFIALAEDASGQDLSAFFQAWLYEPGKPPANP